jgi:sterol desaturase/sphingolipid hydroxylase (fatty acid hydroxylase superfamily)
MIVQTFIDYFAQVQDVLFEAVVQPLMMALDLGEYVEEAFTGTEWFLVGVCELTVLFLLLRPLEALIPVHRIEGSRARWNDFTYTVLNRLGILTVVVFFLLDPLVNMVMEELHLYSVQPFNLDDLWPGVTDRPLVTFLLYLVVLDFFDYWYHRAQHNVRWMWALHSLHHSQRDMNLWSDDRNHILDVFLHDVLMGLVALAIGVAPSQYVLLVVASRMLQSLQHANVRIHFGRIGEYLLVSPRFHRLHHAIGAGHESRGPGSLGGCNFAVLFTGWDVLFRSARFGGGFAMTGVRDQLPPPQGKGRDYGASFWSQQWLGLLRLLRALTGRSAA